MQIRYRYDPLVVEQWTQQCALYRRKTRWLWLAAPIVVATPVLMCVVGTGLFYPAFALGSIGLLAIGVVLGRHGDLLFCPTCGRPPPQARRENILHAEYCRRCASWLTVPWHLRRGDGTAGAAAARRTSHR